MKKIQGRVHYVGKKNNKKKLYICCDIPATHTYYTFKVFCISIYKANLGIADMAEQVNNFIV